MDKYNKSRFLELYDGFEERKLSGIWSDIKFEKNAVKIQSKIVRHGKSALQITINKGDKTEKNKNSKISERDELLEKWEYGPIEDESYQYSFSMFIPRDFPIVSTRLVLAQWKQAEENKEVLVNNPILALRYVNKEFYITLQTTENKIKIFRTKEEIRGKWIDFVFQIRFTRKENGFVKIWMNGKNIVTYKGITAYSEKYNYSDKGKFYFKMGLYRDSMDEPMTIYIDEFRKKHLPISSLPQP